VSFSTDDARLLRDTSMVEIETSRGPGAPVHRTIIWIVADEAGRAFVRSVRGGRGRWFRELVANPHGAVIAAGRRIPVSASAADEEGIAAASRLLREKYRTSRASLASMLRDDVLPTTLELEPAGG
jgi:hypothetical protein